MISITDGLQALYNNNMREKTPLELERENRLLRQQIDQLTNNWNELEEHLNHEIEEWQDVSDKWTKAQVQEDKIILERMKEIKGGNRNG